MAQSSVAAYRPEIRVLPQDFNDGVLSIRLNARGDAKRVELESDADPEQIGEVVLRLMAEAQPAWPTIRSAALLTHARGGFLVHSYRGKFAAGPARRIDADADEMTLASAIRAALDQSSEDSDDSDRGAFSRAIAEAGLEPADLAGGAMVSFRETTRGEIRVQPWEPAGDGWDPSSTAETAVVDGDELAVARLALAAIADVPTRHREPGVATGAAFGYKSAWLAVRDTAHERVADAIGLTARQPLPWREGVDAARDEGVFVSPPTSGWVLAVGVGWFGNEPDVAALSERLAAEVQYFGTHGVVEAHTWERAVDGRLVRRVRYVGESGAFEQEGDATQTELEARTHRSG